MKRLKSVFFCIVILFSFIFTSCTKEKEDDIIIGHEFSEELINSEQVNPELYTKGILYLNNENEISLIDNFEGARYVDENKELRFYYSGEFDNWYFTETTKNGEEIYKINISEIKEIDKEEMIKNEMPEPLGYVPFGGGNIYPLENGNIVLYAKFGEVIKYFEINPNTKELIKFYTYENLQDEPWIYKIAFGTEKYTVMRNYAKGELIFYSNVSGKIDKVVNMPGNLNEGEEFYATEIRVYNGYWYIITTSGLFRCKEGEGEWECLIATLDTQYLSKEGIGVIDVLFKSEMEIYICISSDDSGEGAKSTFSIIKYTISK